jgi:SAM-dependent methyltransferase
VLELGCGTGASSRWLAQLGFHVTAVDVSRVALAAAAAEAAAAGLPPDNPVWLERDVLRLGECQPPLAGEFDLIYDCQGEGERCGLCLLGAQMPRSGQQGTGVFNGAGKGPAVQPPPPLPHVRAVLPCL